MASTINENVWGLKDPSLIKTQGYIDGKWVDAYTGETISVTNPATEELLGTVPEMGREETKAAIAVAERTFQTWSKTTTKYRHDILVKLSVLMQENLDDIARIITLENGKTLAHAKDETMNSAAFIEWYAEEAVRTYGEYIPSPYPMFRNVVIKQPVGPVSILVPWNYPSVMITRKLGAVLAAGCTAVLKPSPETPFSTLVLAELCRRAGVPEGVVNVVTTQKNVQEVGREMCENKIIKKVSFTGSTAVAKSLYKMSSATLKKLALEAGGNAPFIVFDDADLDTSVEGLILGKFHSSAQLCVAPNRILVQSSVYEDFASRLAQKVATFKVGNGLDETSTIGALTHNRALAKVARLVDDAVSKGASILVGGHSTTINGKGLFYAPTVLSDVPTTADINQEEVFGPVVALMKFDTEEEAIALANATDVGLAGYFFSKDVGRAWRVAEALEVGMVGVNNGLVGLASTPFGGVKESGFGYEGGHGIEEYLNQKLMAFAI